MYKFGNRSLQRLNECHPKLQEIMHEVIKVMNVTVLCGYRGEEEQNKAFKEGNSKLQYPRSKHNSSPAMAIDVSPWPVNWYDIESFERMCGIIEGIAQQKNIPIRLGRDFSFKDYPHIELLED